MIEDALVLWDGLVNLAVALISNAYLNLVQATKNVKLGNCQVSETIDTSCVVNNYCVVPATATLTTSGYTVLMANFAEKIARLVKELCWEWARANACEVCLCNAQDAVNVGWTERQNQLLRHQRCS